MNKKEVFVVILLVLALFVGALALHPQQGDVVQAQTPTTLTKVDVVFVYVPCVGKAEVSAIPAPKGAKVETIAMPIVHASTDITIVDTTTIIDPIVVVPPVIVVDDNNDDKDNCNNGAGNGSDCTPGHSSGNNQGNGQQTGDQENQGQQGNGNNDNANNNSNANNNGIANHKSK